MYNRGVITMKRHIHWALAALLLFLPSLAPFCAFASDHADPTNLTDPNANITDLFFYPKDDQYILVFDVRRSLPGPKPDSMPLTPYEYKIYFDFTTNLTFDSAEDRARYGGTIAPEDAPKLHPDATITVRLNEDATLNKMDVQGLMNSDKIRTFTGVRDDPFIFPRFFGVNVIAMVMSLPKNAFPRHDFVLWGTTSKDGVEIDHVGRSVRTQLPRFGIINTSPPKDQLKILTDNKAWWDKFYNFLKGNQEWYSKAVADLIQTTFQLRKYDLVPDVMVYTDRFPAGYPNGRLLTDDVVAKTCEAGDCLAQEISFIEGKWPRATKNDKDFLPDWPYLAEPWPGPQTTPAAPPASYLLPYLIGIALLIAILSWAVIELIRHLIIWLWFKYRRKPQPEAA
jgi:hypothetical protein